MDSYLAYIESESTKENKFFYIDIDGINSKHFYNYKGMIAREITGWLINIDKKDLFLKDVKKNLHREKFCEEYHLVQWSKTFDNTIFIRFKPLKNSANPFLDLPNLNDKTLNPYVEFVCKIADKQNHFFLIDSGESNEYFSKKGWTIEELSGWYVPLEQKSMLIEYIRQNRDNGYDGKFSENFVLVHWPKSFEEEISIEFSNWDELFPHFDTFLVRLDVEE